MSGSLVPQVARDSSTSLREGGISDFWSRSMLIVFTLTTFISATLLFLVQPLFAKMVLPLLGGAPAVWNTAMLFFQFSLLGGYAFAHFGPRLLGLRRHALLQVIVVALPVLLIPMSIPAGTSPPTENNPTFWLLGFMLITVGAPFFALSTTSPTIQHWLASSGHARADNPYFLYIASNVGSLLALLAYPVVVEPLLSLRVQQQLWGYGYGLLALLTLVSSVILLRNKKAGTAITTEMAHKDSAVELRPTARIRASWVLGAFIPSSLLLGVTASMSSEVAAVPLLWIVPMALYLVTFILAFAAWRKPSDDTLRRILALLGVPLVLVVALNQRIQPISGLILLNLAAFFVAALLCHRRLADSRPVPRHLTEFYLWLSTGGMLGGVFNALIAPVLFKSHLEYPLVLLLACLYALQRSGSATTAGSTRNAILLPAATILTSGLALLLIKRFGPGAPPSLPLLCMLVPAVMCFLASKHSYAFTASLAVLLFAGHAAHTSLGTQLFVERSFFGISKVTEDSTQQLRHLSHGLTIHGTQSTRPELRRKALIYYHDYSPSGRVLAELGTTPEAHIGVIGLGAGSLAAYAKPGQSWTFFEIDPVVVRVASDPRLFTFLSDSPVPARLVLGDARLTLAQERDHQFDLLVIDAYSSDAIPIHLITREAFALYLTKLKPGGAILCHVSNNYLDLEPVVGGIAAALGLTALTSIDNTDGEEGRSASTWMVLYAGDRAHFITAKDNTWHAARFCPPHQIWQDDFSSILNVMRWK